MILYGYIFRNTKVKLKTRHVLLKRLNELVPWQSVRICAHGRHTLHSSLIAAIVDPDRACNTLHSPEHSITPTTTFRTLHPSKQQSVVYINTNSKLKSAKGT